jgi:hypothetical protein
MAWLLASDCAVDRSAAARNSRQWRGPCCRKTSFHGPLQCPRQLVLDRSVEHERPGPGRGRTGGGIELRRARARLGMHQRAIPRRLVALFGGKLHGLALDLALRVGEPARSLAGNSRFEAASGCGALCELRQALLLGVPLGLGARPKGFDVRR